MTNASKRAMIVGCGVSGPVLAMYLKKAGLDPVIYERRSESTSAEGGSFGLAPNGLDVLRTLGLADAVTAAGNPTEQIGFVNHKGKELGMNPESTTLINRGELQKILVGGAEKAGVEFEFGKRFVGATQNDGTVVAKFDDYSEAEADLLIGCDGLRSLVRHTVVPEARTPTYTGVVDCGGFGNLPGRLEADGTMRMVFGLRGFFGYQALPDGTVFWFENHGSATEPDYKELREIPDADWRAKLMEIHKDDLPLINEIIGSSGEVDRYSIYEAPTMEVWHRGHVALVGDAAHAMGPHTGQGASMALEDAITLARCLRDTEDIPTAFAAYVAERKPRVTQVIKDTQRTGAQKSPGPIGRMIRDLVLPFFVKMQVGKTTSLYSHHIDW